MTSKQYENIGRAVEQIVRLNAQAEEMYESKRELGDRLGRLIGNDVSHRFVNDQYGTSFPQIHAIRDFLDIVENLIMKEESKERSAK